MRQLLVCLLLVALTGPGVAAAKGHALTSKPRVATPRPMKFLQPPPMSISKNKRYVATIATNDGSFTIELLPRLAPVTVNNFVFLTRRHFYDNVIFHRIIRDFMLQTGDPTATGEGGPGYEFNDELHPSYHLHYYPGTVAMANHGPNTNGSQFFIVTGSQGLALKGNYTIFGFVSTGWKVVQKIARTPVGRNLVTTELSQPLIKVYMRSITVRVLPALHKGSPKPPKHQIVTGLRYAPIG